MELTDQQLCITSYNSTGFGRGVVNFMETLLSFSDILCIQEHFLQDSGQKKYSNTNKIKVAFPNYDMLIKPAAKSNNQVCRGRAKGGLAILWNPKLTKYITKVDCHNFRISAAKLSLPSGSLLLVNTYFPCDPQKADFDDTELQETLLDITNILESSACTSLLVAGDLNCDLTRNNRFTDQVRNHFQELNLKFFWEASNENINFVDFTHESSNRGKLFHSTIDHFVSNSRVLNVVSEAGVIHHADNTSSHSPIYAKLKVGLLNTELEIVKPTIRSSWAGASSDARDNYRSLLSQKLNEIKLPDSHNCQNLFCNEHFEQISDYTLNVLEAVEDAALECLPLVGLGANGKKKNLIPCWNEVVKPFQEESKFWHSLWLSAGKPREGQLFTLMRYSKHHYKYAIRRLQRGQNKVQKDKFLSAILSGGSNIFEEIKKFRGKSKKCSSIIDGNVGGEKIANQFANGYKQLYNIENNADSFSSLRHMLNDKISGADIIALNSINDSVIRQGLKRLKHGKSDAVHNFQSDCLINGPPDLIPHLTRMIKMMFSHGQIPTEILVCSLLPLVKDNLGDLTSSANYRAIATSSQILKLLDVVILILEADKLHCDQLQFGFQPKASTTMCSWMISTVIDKYNQQGSPVYCCTMDLTKAFDMVRWPELFTELLEKKISPIFLRTLLFIYVNQRCVVQWNGSSSNSFKVHNGVRQGAVSSPLLFSIYIDKLFSLLRSSGFGCRLFNVFYGCFGYADDILLLSASRSGLQAMVDIANKFMRKKGLKFSTDVIASKSKTKCILFSQKRIPYIEPIKLDGNNLPWVTDIRHLGNVLESNNSMKKDVNSKRGQFIGKVNCLLQEFYFAEPSSIIRILNMYTVSFPGSCLWDLFSSDCDRLYRAWNVTMRQALNLPRNTHRYLIEAVSNCLHLKVMLCSRYCKFVNAIMTSPKYPVRLMGSLCLNDQRTIMGKNLSNIRKGCGVKRQSDLTPAFVKKNLRYFKVPECEVWRERILKELLSNEVEIDGFTQHEVDEVIEYLCTT